MTTGLEAHGLAVQFGDGPGLAELNFEVAAGERLVILGPSGAGKTSLLRALAGLAPVAAGRIFVGGRDVTRLPAERRDTVYLHQTPLLFPHLSVFENVAFPLRIRRTPGKSVRATVERLLRSVQLDGFGPRSPHSLSGGQRHRVALARAMAARPALLLLDEPLASLDPPLRDELRGTLFDLQAEYRPAVVIVTHDLEDAAALGHRIGVLLGRRLVQVAPPEDLFRRPASAAVARLLGLINEVSGHCCSGHFVSALGPIPTAEPLPDGAAVAMFGPDALQEDENGIETPVVALRHGPGRILVSVRLGGALLSYAPAPRRLPRIGDRVRLVIDSGLLSIYPTPPDA